MRAILTAAAAIALAGCMVGPDYQRPPAPTPVAFKELAGWKISQPADATDKGAWWSIYHDPELDRLERMVVISNQNVKAFDAQYREAIALIAEARSGLFPTIGVDTGVLRSGGGSSGTSFSTGGITTSGGGATSSSRGSSGRGRINYNLTGNVSWDLDVWGRVRRQVESDVAGAQVSAADLANATLSAQGTLATTYFNLRYEDSLQTLLQRTVGNFRRALQIVSNQYRAGTSANNDVVTAQAQLESAQADLVGVGVQRQQFEHAIAVLTGQPPADLTIAPGALPDYVPVSPAGVPSALLERRPDVAAAERQMQQQNALIGVNVAAYYPDISLSALGGFSGDPLSRLINASNTLWSLGASGSESLFEGGLRTAQVAAAKANYDNAVATYRQAVLTAFQQVEDALSGLRILEQQSVAEARAVRSTRRAVQIVLNTYLAGTTAYTNVITEQNLLLTDEESALTVQQSRLTNSVNLVQALGGGWTTHDLPSRDQLQAFDPLVP
jgi:NodT family efflux transporter outer membrane factor (OMF) lipoprotein